MNQQESPINKNNKNVHSKPKKNGMFKWFFSKKHKLKTSKSHYDVKSKSPQIKYNNSTGVITTTNESSMTSSSYSEYPSCSQNAGLLLTKTKAPLASLESLSIKDNDKSTLNNNNNTNNNCCINKNAIPVINEDECINVIVESQSINNSYNNQNDTNNTNNTNDQQNKHLNLPIDRSRKSSADDDDSAVDLKFQDDSSTNRNSHINPEYSEASSSLSLGITPFVSTGLDFQQKSDNSDNDNFNVNIDNNKSNNNNNNMEQLKIKRTESVNSWRKIKLALIWTPFIQQCAKHQYPWIQIAGHQGNFKPGEQGTILKKHCARESICLQMMRDDILANFVPEFKSDVEYEGGKYICMEDLLAKFDQPSLMDIKMGTRTYLEEELTKAHKCPKPRQDMYEKMVAVDKNEPTDEEHKIKGVLKPRYMIWRETLSSSVNLGFRIEGVKKVVGTQSRSFKKTKERHEVKEVLEDFIDGKVSVMEAFLERLNKLKEALSKSDFFWKHEFIGSSLLFVYDRNNKANVWMIDFGKTVPAPPNIQIDHESEWNEGNHEDGYLFGMNNLIQVLTEIHHSHKDSSTVTINSNNTISQHLHSDSHFKNLV